MQLMLSGCISLFVGCGSNLQVRHRAQAAGTVSQLTWNRAGRCPVRGIRPSGDGKSDYSQHVCSIWTPADQMILERPQFLLETELEGTREGNQIQFPCRDQIILKSREEHSQKVFFPLGKQKPQSRGDSCQGNRARLGCAMDVTWLISNVTDWETEAGRTCQGTHSESGAGLVLKPLFLTLGANWAWAWGWALGLSSVSKEGELHHVGGRRYITPWQKVHIAQVRKWTESSRVKPRASCVGPALLTVFCRGPCPPSPSQVLLSPLEP